MALMHVSVYSLQLKRTTEFHVVTPDRPGDVLRTAPVVVLLHGWAGNHHDWLHGSSVVQQVQDRGFVAVLPSGGNHFYLDAETEEAHAQWLVQELPETLERLFSLSWDPQRCFLGGYSMGGYGALRNTLAFPHRFGGAFALSSALITDEIARLKPGERTPYASYAYYRQVFGDLGQLKGSDKDVEALVVRRAAETGPRPRLYVTCGTDDFLLSSHQSLARTLARVQWPHFAQELPGGHDFTFWDGQLGLALDWLGLGRRA